MRSRLAIVSALAAASFGLTACQAISAITGEDESAAMRGRQTAQARCAACHYVGKSGTSPRAGAPAFGDLARRYSAQALVWELEASAAVGHYGMPIVQTSAAERESLAAYVRSLGGRSDR